MIILPSNKLVVDLHRGSCLFRVTDVAFQINSDNVEVVDKLVNMLEC